ncbi:glycosyl hydrolase family 25 [Methylovirgula sp. 4M-Z18]|nr:glycosyl hydrolase family 25 [Methylovirgula sp. 4M-Z18]
MFKATHYLGLALLLGVAGCSTLPESRSHAYRMSEAISYAREYPVQGIDVSKYQGEIDWHRVRSSGIRFAWIKATEGGDHLDERFQENWENSKAAGVKRGAYHFVFWCRPWYEEINWFKQNVPVEPDALPPVLDVEATPDSKSCHRHLSKEEVVPEMRAMLTEMERYYGKKPIIYSTVDFYQAILSDGDLSDFPIWVRSTKYEPTHHYGDRKWHFWQYQADGNVPGIEAKVDRNVFFGNERQWHTWLNVDDQQQVAVDENVTDDQ